VLWFSAVQKDNNSNQAQGSRPIGWRADARPSSLAIGFLTVLVMLGLVGCGPIDLGFLSSIESQSADVAAAEEANHPSVESPLELIGESGDAVRRLLGEPRGRLHTADGVVWLYPQWRVQLDAQQQVTAVERELAVPVATPAASSRSAAVPVGGGSTHQRALTVVSNGGREVDLGSLLAPGKITVVDFYADWCGPCRRLSPHLERLAREDPDVNVVKVDIVKWNTPVTRQYNIRSVPNLRVYDRSGRVVGSPTSDFRQVLRQVEQAKR
jgi:thioredoxin 1